MRTSNPSGIKNARMTADVVAATAMRPAGEPRPYRGIVRGREPHAHAADAVQAAEIEVSFQRGDDDAGSVTHVTAVCATGTPAFKVENTD